MLSGLLPGQVQTGLLFCKYIPLVQMRWIVTCSYLLFAVCALFLSMYAWSASGAASAALDGMFDTARFVVAFTKGFNVLLSAASGVASEALALCDRLIAALAHLPSKAALAGMDACLDVVFSANVTVNVTQSVECVHSIAAAFASASYVVAPQASVTAAVTLFASADVGLLGCSSSSLPPRKKARMRWLHCAH